MSQKGISGKLTPSIRRIIEGPGYEQIGGSVEIVNGRFPQERMTFGNLTPKRPIDYRVIAEFIRACGSANSAFYLDTCFFTGGEKPKVLWEALLEKEIVITPLVWTELQPWIGTPFRNQWMRDILVDARLSKPSNIRFAPDDSWHSFHCLAAGYYVNLLAVRKRQGLALAQQFVEKHGHQPTKEEYTHLITQLVPITKGC